MAEFKIQIAAKTAAVTSLFDSTRDYCRHYLTELPPHFSVCVTRADLEREQALAIEEAREEGFRIRIFPDPYLERAAIQRQFAEYLLFSDTLLFHGSAVAVDGNAYLFTAKSGTGKSTHTRLWREVFGSRAVMINDDKPFLRFTPSGILVCGAPWSGKHGLDTNISLPLRSICVLERGTENRIQPLMAQEAMPRLQHESYRPLDPHALPIQRSLTETLAGSVPLWQMKCTKDKQAAYVAFETMSGAAQSDFSQEKSLS